MLVVVFCIEVYNIRLKGIMGGVSLLRFSEVCSVFCVKFLCGIIYVIIKLFYE